MIWLVATALLRVMGFCDDARLEKAVFIGEAPLLAKSENKRVLPHTILTDKK